MKILYVCDKLITFVLNEVIELNNLNNEIYILSNHKDKQIYNNITRPVLKKHNLINRTFCRFNYFNSRREKLMFFLKAVCKDFIKNPLITLKVIINTLKIYSKIGTGIEKYLDIRNILSVKPDIIHAPFSTPDTIDYVCLLSKSLKVPFTLSFRAHDIYENDNLKKLQNKMKIIQSASRLITISKYNKVKLERYFKTDKSIDIIHSAIYLDFFKKGYNKKKQNSIVSVCRLHEQKGIIFLIEACHILNKRNIDYKCTIIGEGSEIYKYKELINRYNIPNIEFINFMPQEQIRDYLDNAAVFVLPCVIAKNGSRDILANSIKEAMAMELPVITSKICGIEELIEHRTDGILVPPEDSESIADAVFEVFENVKFGQKIGKAGRIKIENNFNVENEANKMNKIFYNILHA